jgi:hypothetical protein
LLIDKYPPIIHRVSIKLSEDRTLLLHKLFNTKNDKALMHSHSWNFACKVLDGEYEMGVGFSKNRDEPPSSVFTSFIKAGDIYEMLSPNIWHYTKPLKHIDCTHSVMLIGPRIRDRQAQNNEKLSNKDKTETLNWFKDYFNE